MPRRIRCPGCGAPMDSTGACGFCGASAALEGLAGRLLPSDLRCPRCPSRPDLRGLDHEGHHAEICLQCRGAWFGPGVLEQVVRRAAKRPPVKGEGTAGPAHGAVEPVRYARCPRCDGGMTREPFCRKPLVIVDRCPSHGDWVDGGELGQIQAVARSRGVDAALGRRSRPQVRSEVSDAERDSPLGGKRFAGEPLVPRAVSRNDARAGRGGLFEDRSGRVDLFDLLGDLFGGW